jgi:hypothetical protein
LVKADHQEDGPALSSSYAESSVSEVDPKLILQNSSEDNSGMVSVIDVPKVFEVGGLSHPSALGTAQMVQKDVPGDIEEMSALQAVHSDGFLARCELESRILGSSLLSVLCARTLEEEQAFHVLASIPQLNGRLSLRLQPRQSFTHIPQTMLSLAPGINDDVTKW